MGHKYVKEDETFNISQNGVVPKPTAQEVTDNKYLRADGTWQIPPGGGGGSTVSITPTLLSGTKIADFEIDGNAGELYAPSGGSSAHIYSTSEQVVGTWIDGKPIYEKTVVRDSNFSTDFFVNYTLDNCKSIIDVRGMILCGTGYEPLNTAVLNTNVFSWKNAVYDFSANRAHVEIGADRLPSVTGVVLIFTYTKTTD